MFANWERSLVVFAVAYYLGGEAGKFGADVGVLVPFPVASKIAPINAVNEDQRYLVRDYQDGDCLVSFYDRNRDYQTILIPRKALGHYRIAEQPGEGLR